MEHGVSKLEDDYAQKLKVLSNRLNAEIPMTSPTSTGLQNFFSEVGLSKENLEVPQGLY